MIKKAHFSVVALLLATYFSYAKEIFLEEFCKDKHSEFLLDISPKCYSYSQSKSAGFLKYEVIKNSKAEIKTNTQTGSVKMIKK